jgi:hypothetical protein
MASILFGSDDDVNHLLPPEVDPPPPGLPFLPPWFEEAGPFVLELPLISTDGGLTRIIRIVLESDAENPTGGLSDKITLIWIPAPGTLVLLGLAGLTTGSRRRRA